MTTLRLKHNKDISISNNTNIRIGDDALSHTIKRLQLQISFNYSKYHIKILYIS